MNALAQLKAIATKNTEVKTPQLASVAKKKC